MSSKAILPRAVEPMAHITIDPVAVQHPTMVEEPTLEDLLAYGFKMGTINDVIHPAGSGAMTIVIDDDHYTGDWRPTLGALEDIFGDESPIGERILYLHTGSMLQSLHPLTKEMEEAYNQRDKNGITMTRVHIDIGATLSGFLQFEAPKSATRSELTAMAKAVVLKFWKTENAIPKELPAYLGEQLQEASISVQGATYPEEVSIAHILSLKDNTWSGDELDVPTSWDLSHEDTR